MRIVLHIDMNSYFATAEQQANPFLRGKPICVAGKGSSDPSRRGRAEAERTVCCAASIEAKKFGIKSGFPVWEAQRLCPSIQIVPADYAKYEFISRRFIEILENYSPLVEIFSIDEAFLDLSDRCQTLEEAIPIAQEIKSRLREEVGDYLTCSVGVAPNKLLAKLASEMVKPDGLVVIRPTEIQKILEKTPIEDLCGIGPRLTQKLNLLNINFVWELGNYPLEKLQKFFGPHQGKLLKMFGAGLDPSPVIPFYDLPNEKSFGHSYTLPRNLTDLVQIKKVLLKLSEKVGRRARHARMIGRTICFYVRFFDFTSAGRMLTYNRFSNDGQEIFKRAAQILDQIGTQKPVRLVGVSLTNLKKISQTSGPILAQDQTREKIVKTLDKINDKYGEFTIFQGALTHIKDKIQEIPDGRRKRF